MVWIIEMVQGVICIEHRLFNICEKFPTLKMCLYWAAPLYSYPYCSKAPNTRVKYVVLLLKYTFETFHLRFLLTRAARVLVFQDRPLCHSNFSSAYFSLLTIGTQFHRISIHSVIGVCNLHPVIERLSIISQLRT